MKIGIGSDHRGYKLKSNIIEKLLSENYTVEDFGAMGTDAVDYPDFGFKVGEAIRDKKVDVGILICGTGIGISIAANKVKDVRCAKVDNKEDAMYAKLHNDANAIAFTADSTLEEAMDMVHVYLETTFSPDERHHRRVDKINRYK